MRTKNCALGKICERGFRGWRGVTMKQKGKILKLSNLNYRKFRLFLLTLLWRTGVSELEFFSETNLGDKHQEILRCALLAEDRLEPLQYPCFMSVVCINRQLQTDWISQPMHNKSGSYHCHCVIINGILF